MAFRGFHRLRDNSSQAITGNRRVPQEAFQQTLLDGTRINISRSHACLSCCAYALRVPQVKGTAKVYRLPGCMRKLRRRSPSGLPKTVGRVRTQRLNPAILSMDKPPPYSFRISDIDGRKITKLQWSPECLGWKGGPAAPAIETKMPCAGPKQNISPAAGKRLRRATPVSLAMTGVPDVTLPPDSFLRQRTLQCDVGLLRSPPPVQTGGACFPPFMAFFSNKLIWYSRGLIALAVRAFPVQLNFLP